MNLDDHFQKRYDNLNPEQKKAVDTIEGPVMVIAGPGSGKTELLGLRVANILRLTDTLPSSILCLTYTETGAVNMRKRLAGLIGLDAYKVAIHTFHGFGTEVINTNPEYFYQGARYNPADELTRLRILEEILKDLPYDSLLRSYHPEQGYTYLKDIITKMGELKKGGLSPRDFRAVLTENRSFLEQANPFLDPVFQEKISKKTVEHIPELLAHLKGVTFQQRPHHLLYRSVRDILVTTLEDAYAIATSEEKPDTKPITAWKGEYMKKDDDAHYLFKDLDRIDKQFELCNVYETYQEQLHKEGFFDFEDMLLDTIDAFEKHPELRYNLQERYLYLLVDEFQDTNGVQMRILDKLLDNDIHEGRPNILAVGDDDQAIFKFQGANIANIMEFHQKYRDPTLVVLQQNYRSTQLILDYVRTVILKGQDRLECKLPDLVKKELYAANTNLSTGEVAEKIFPTDLEELVWVAETIQQKLSNGTPPSSIAVIARKHKTLELAAKVLDFFGIPVSYERKKNLLEQKHIKELITILRFVHTIGTKRQIEADEYLPEILSFPFWGVARVAIWKVSVKAWNEKKLWLEVMLESEDERLRNIAAFLIHLGIDAKEKTAEEIIDMITGAEEEGSSFQSPYKAYYFNSSSFKDDKLDYLNLLQALQALIEKVRGYRGTGAKSVADIIELVELHEQHHLDMHYTNVFNNDEKAVNLLTAHGAKGLEFENVFLLSCHDTEWTKASSAVKLSLPTNVPLAAESETDDDKLRLFYVALTRARENLYLTRHQYNDKGSELVRLRFLENGDSEKKEKKNHLDAATVATMQSDFTQSKGLEKLLLLRIHIENHDVRNIEENDILMGLLKDYKLSVTHLNNFLDITKGGPQTFLEQNLLRFPQRPLVSGIYGNSMHHALSIFLNEFKSTKVLPSLEFLLKEFEYDIKRQRLNKKDLADHLAKGRDHLTTYYQAQQADFNPDDQSEFDFKNQGVVIDGAELTGKIDKMRYDEENREILVYDYKTGKPFKDWNNGASDHEKIKAWRYRNQLVFYKLLVENARDLRGKYTVKQGFLEFLEPVGDKIILLPLDITDEETERMKRLVVAVYKRIMNLNFPHIEGYEKSLDGIEEFVEGLLERD